MPEVQEVYRMATQKVRPDPGALERQRQKQRFHTGKQKAALFALAAGLLVGAVLVGISLFRDTEERPAAPPSEQAPPAGQEETIEGLPPTVERITGVWISEAGDGLMTEFTADGEWITDNGGLLDTDPWNRGTYEIHDRTITMVSERSPQEGGYFCMRLEAGLPEDGRLVTIAREDSDCLAFAGTEITFIRVSPPSPGSAAITAEVPSDGWSSLPLGTGSLFRGIWFLEGGGHLLRLATDGTYALDGDGTLVTEPDDVGTFEVDSEAGTITLTSGDDSRNCSEGDTSVWVDAQYGGGLLRGELDRSDCAAHQDLVGTWIRISS